MNLLQQIFQWFSGGAQQYHTLVTCMRGDTFWIATTVALDLLVAGGYAMIAVHWWRNQKQLAHGPAKSALSGMRNIFIFCGLCGYLFIPIKMFWPAWRLYDFFLVVLVYFTWRYAFSARNLKVIYSELGLSSRLAADLRKSKEESRRKSFFLNAISHDLRTPLNALSLQADLLSLQSQNGLDGAMVQETVSQIKANTLAASELLTHLLEYARLSEASDRNVPRDVDIAHALAGCAKAFEASANVKGLYVRCECPRHLAVRTDAMKLDRILKNLVSNALKFTRVGGVTIVAAISGDRLQIRVSDTGIGISADDQEHLFDEFFQAGNSERDRKKGFGLGLAIARQLAQQLDGDISCSSTIGSGSSFCLDIPATAAEQQSLALREGDHQPEPVVAAAAP